MGRENIVLITFIAIAMFAESLNAHEPNNPNAGSIPVYGRGPVIGHYRPTLTPVPTLFPHFARYRRGYVYQPVQRQPMPNRNPQPAAMPVRYDDPAASYTFDYQGSR